MAEALVPATTISDFYYKECTNLTPDLYYYDNIDEDGAEGIPDKYPSLPATSEVNFSYLNVDLILPRGTGKSRGHLTKRARDNDGNPMGDANPNPTLKS